MITLSDLATLLGWTSVINIGFLALATTSLVFMRDTVCAIHTKMFGIPESELALIYFKNLANYKTLLLLFSLAPYLALKLMGY